LAPPSTAAAASSGVSAAHEIDRRAFFIWGAIPQSRDGVDTWAAGIDASRRRARGATEFLLIRAAPFVTVSDTAGYASRRGQAEQDPLAPQLRPHPTPRPAKNGNRRRSSSWRSPGIRA
jgi:hypothetical protein